MLAADGQITPQLKSIEIYSSASKHGVLLREQIFNLGSQSLLLQYGILEKLVTYNVKDRETEIFYTIHLGGFSFKLNLQPPQLPCLQGDKIVFIGMQNISSGFKQSLVLYF